ncbi:hypothetical protein VTN96DRAFT_6411 [Rasamsonia emersonii]
MPAGSRAVSFRFGPWRLASPVPAWLRASERNGSWLRSAHVRTGLQIGRMEAAILEADWPATQAESVLKGIHRA